MATQNPDIAFSVIAKDRASSIFNRLSQSSGRLGTVWRGLTGIVARLGTSMLVLSVALPVVSAAFAGLIGAATAVSFINFERGARRTRVQLQLLGFTATEARDQISTLTDLMDRATATSFFASQQAINNIGLGFTELNAILVPLSEKFADIIGANPAQVFNALFDAFARHDPTKFAELVTGVADLAIPMQVLDSLEGGDSAPFLLWLQRITEEENLTRIENLTTQLERLAEITRPAREAVVTAAATTVGVFIESLATHLERGRDRLKTVLLLAFTGAFAVAGRGLGVSLGTFILVGLTGLILADSVDTLTDAFNNPGIVAGIALIGFALGRKLGGTKGGLVGGLVFVIGLELLPGLVSAFEDLRFSQQIELSGFALGIVIGLATKRGFGQSFVLGGLIQSSLSALLDEDANAAQGATVIGFTAIGAILGGRFVGGFQGALVGGLIGNVVGTLLASATADRLALEAGQHIGRFLLDGILGIFVELPILLANEIIKSINIAINDVAGLIGIGGFLPGIPNIPLIPNPVPDILNPPGPFIGPPLPPPPPPTTFGGTPLGPGPTGTPFDPDIVHGPFPFDPDFDFAHGGMVPGPLGAPVLARVHGGETVLPGGATMIIQLVLDRRIVSEIAVDAVNRTARLNAGMVPGSIGS